MYEQGGCQCGAVRYEVEGSPAHVALCHCEDCRKSSGAPAVAWAAFAEDKFLLLQGDLTEFNSSGAAMRSFCPSCGTGIAYRNAEMLRGIVDIQAATLDNPSVFPLQCHIQTADRIDWMTNAAALPEFERYPE
ncbi:GFA family protein [Sphingorhabdus sp.]|uniref:GFA family protein n=1 Tax=Sphingorhabdus sp. TaxID=1902408 RepID=UPI00391A7164